jgi:hypothetical protein
MMGWFRDHIRHGSWFALVALAINLGLSFGHIHAIGGKDFQHRFTSIAAIASPDDGPTPGHHDGDPADLFCPICMAASSVGHALASAAPALPLVFAESQIDQAIEPAIAIKQPPRAAFHSRGPPIS